jgi:hypothetical protein
MSRRPRSGASARPFELLHARREGRMMTKYLAAALVVWLLGIPTVHAVSTDQDALDKVLGKGSTLPTEKDKFGCACLSVPLGAGGVVRRIFDSNTGRFHIECVVQTFNAAGQKVAESGCANWVLIGK